jgi:hypothetical protein
MNEELLVTIMPREDGRGVDVDMAGEISAKPLIVGTAVMAARVCKLTDISAETFCFMLNAAMQKEGTTQ